MEISKVSRKKLRIIIYKLRVHKPMTDEELEISEKIVEAEYRKK